MSKEALQSLNGYKIRIWQELNKYLKDPVYPDEFLISNEYKQELDYHWKIVNEYPSRQGKYIRPILLVLTAESLGVGLTNSLKTACAMQLSEEWLLIHDDLEDGSMERRGKETLHRIYGTDLAVNAGDALQIIMWKALFDNLELLGKKKSKLISDEFHTILTRTTIGQTTELKWIKENKLNFSDEDWYFVCDGKTSYYTIAGPIRLGGIIAGADDKQLKLLTQFGLNMGRCFQIVDDVLDLTSDFSGLKKQIGNDIYEGKRTLMLGHLIRNANTKDKKEVVAIYSKNRSEKTPEEVNWIINKMKQYGSIDYAKNLAKKFKDNSMELFNNRLDFITIQPARDHLKELITFILEREF